MNGESMAWVGPFVMALSVLTFIVFVAIVAAVVYVVRRAQQQAAAAEAARAARRRGETPADDGSADPNPKE